jgi:hypothetical protein
VFWVISVYFNIRNTLLKSGKFLLGHPVYEHTESMTVCSPLSSVIPVFFMKNFEELTLDRATHNPPS